MSDQSLGFFSQPSSTEAENRKKFFGLYQENPVASGEVLDNLGLFMRRQTLSKFLFMNELYQQVLDIQGVVIEFGVRWGQNLAFLTSLRGIYEPFNHQRRIIGFDTFEGFPSVSAEDGLHAAVQAGAFAVTPRYEDYLEKVLSYHESESPIAHIRKFELRKGDAAVQLEQFLADNPQVIIAMAYFDFDIYEPTKKCLELIKPYVTKGTVIGFDELNNKAFPGETVAVRQSLGLSRFAVKTSKFAPAQSYLVVDDVV